MSKVRKVYHLRKTIANKTVGNVDDVKELDSKESEDFKMAQLLDKSQLAQGRDTLLKPIHEPRAEFIVDGSELLIDKLDLKFEAQINSISLKEVKIKNIGSSAVYVEWVIKNSPKVNPNGTKDSKPKFYCHCKSTVIKPGQQNTVIFNFLSEFPGHFAEQVQINCQPPLQTQIPPLQLTGKASIADIWESGRKKFINALDEEILVESVRQTLMDLVNSVRLPPPPRPDVSDIRIAQRQFQLQNSAHHLHFNPFVHRWFNELFNTVCNKLGLPEAGRYWDQSIDSLKELITTANCLDDVDKKYYLDRLEHYCHLSLNSMPNKSSLYDVVFEFVGQTAYKLGESAASVRKELDMWEMTFREPLTTDTPDDLKARKEEIDKIKAEWLKKAKKKKWGEEEERQLLNQYRNRLQRRVTEDLLGKFTNFEEAADYIKVKKIVKKFNSGDYFRSLQRMKTVKEMSLEGKKVIIKFDLKLKAHCEDKLKQLKEYLSKKAEEEKSIEEEKRNNEGNAKKKKVAPKTKKKGQKGEEEAAPLHFDFLSILDEQNWNGLMETFKTVMQKNPFLVLLACRYGPRSGRAVPEYSVRFLLEHFKAQEASIEFLTHNELMHLSDNIRSETINEGSIFLTENINFLPCETMQEQQIIEDSIVKRKLLQPQIRQFFDGLSESIDVLVDEDQLLEQNSGISTYLNKQSVLGTLWWKYIGLSMRAAGANVIIDSRFSPQIYLLLNRLATYAHKIYLVGQLGVQFYIASNQLKNIAKYSVSESERHAILETIEAAQGKIVIPKDLVLTKGEDPAPERLINIKEQNIPNYTTVDIGVDDLNAIQQIGQGSLFILCQKSYLNSQDIPHSWQVILKHIYRCQQLKRERHSIQINTHEGIDFSQDLVVYLVGIQGQLIENMDLKQKKDKAGEQQADEIEEDQNQHNKIDLIADFTLESFSCISKLLSGQSLRSLKDIDKYPQILESN